MATKLKKFTVAKRFEIWVEEQISAPDFETAVKDAKEMKVWDFVKFNRTHLDSTELPGLSISEIV